MGDRLTEIIETILLHPGAEAIQDVILGVVLLALGGEGIVRGAVGLARRFNLSPLLVGIVIVSVGTSAPEFGVAVMSVLVDQIDIGVGTAIGSNIANVLLILALGALLRPLFIRDAAIVRDGLAFVAAAGLLVWVLYQLGGLDVAIGGIFVGVLIFYLIVCLVSELTLHDADQPAAERSGDAATVGGLIGQNAVSSVLFVVIGIVALFFGAYFIIEGTVGFARQQGIGEAALSLSVVALGACLPELVAMLFGVIRKQPDLVIGNVIGSSIINIFGVLGLAALLSPQGIDLARVFSWDILVMFAAALILIPFMLTGRRLSRLEASLMLAAYVGYVYYVLNFHPSF